jgi:hypothetical protein
MEYWGPSYAGTSHVMTTHISISLTMRYEDWQETIAKVSATVKPFSGLRLDFSYAPKYSKYAFKNVNKPTKLYDYKTGEVIFTSFSPGSITETRDQTKEEDINILANYVKTIGKHDIAVLGGFQYLTNSFNSLSGYRQVNEFHSIGGNQCF